MKRKLFLLILTLSVSLLFLGCSLIPSSLLMLGFWEVTSITTYLPNGESENETFPYDDEDTLVQIYILFLENTFHLYNKETVDGEFEVHQEEEINFTIEDDKIIFDSENYSYATFKARSKTITLTIIPENEPSSIKRLIPNKIVLKANRANKSIMDDWVLN